MKPILLQDDLGMNSILKEERCIQIIVIKGNILKIQ